MIAGIEPGTSAPLRVNAMRYERTREIGELTDGRTYTEVDIMGTSYKPESKNKNCNAGVNLI